MKTFALAALLSAALASTAVAGPPWLTVEIRPAGAPFLVVHTFHHGTAAPMALQGTAEGLVNGRRVSVPLQFEAVSGTGNAFAVARTWEGDGVWVLSIVADGGAHGGAAAAVTVDRAGSATVTFPRRYDGTTRPVSNAEVGMMLRAIDSGEPLPLLSRTGWFSMAMRLAVPIFFLALIVAAAVKLVSAATTRLKTLRVRPRSTVAALFALSVAGAAVPAVAGAPWISVELPANPMDPATRGAFAVVRTYRHAEPMPFVVTGRAEGLVAGQRRSVPMRIVATGRTGAMAIMKNWPSDGVWVLKMGVDGMQMDAAIGVGTDGEVAFVRVPTTRDGAPRTISGAEVEDMLRSLSTGSRLAASR